VHTQFWDEKLDYTNKEVVIIGSGATAVTVLPAMAQTAKHVTMLQRTPNYLMSQASEDGVERFIRTWLPKTWAHTIIRWKWLWISYFMLKICRSFPKYATRTIRDLTTAELPPQVKLDPHFKPSYNPWEQRMCLCPNGDFFEALRKGNANIVTAVIDQVTENSIKLKDGQELHPDIIVRSTTTSPSLSAALTWKL
jgi:cation diffusion facilitator CzcD-associated flavoprotein CzcO